MINVAGHWYPPNNHQYFKYVHEYDKETDSNNKQIHPHYISSKHIFDEYEKVQRAEFISTMLTVRCADHLLAPTGLVMFCGTKNAIENDPKAGTPLEKIAKGVVM